MGRVLAESILLLDGKCVVGYMKPRDMDFYGVKPSGPGWNRKPAPSDERCGGGNVYL